MVSTTAAAKYHYGTNKVTKEATKGAPSSSPNFKQGLKESAYNFYSLREHFIITFGCINKEDEGYQEKMKYMWRNSSHAILNQIISQTNNLSKTSSLNIKTCQSLIKIQKSFVVQKHHHSLSAKPGTWEGEKLHGSSKKTQLTAAKPWNTPSKVGPLFSHWLLGCWKLPILAWGKF